MILMFPWIEKKEEPKDFYFQLELTEDGMKTLEKLVLGEKVTERSKERLKTCLMYVRRMDYPLVGLPWGKLRERAVERHSSEADALWDWERK